MKINWKRYVDAIGIEENGKYFSELIVDMLEDPVVEDDPIGIDDFGWTRHYKFMKLGVEMGFRRELLNHIHFFLESDSVYDGYVGDLGGIGYEWDEGVLIENLGVPNRSGGGKYDPLIGYVRKWVKYQMKGYSIHIEFSDSHRISQVSLMK